jgi:hypothetical protein
VKGRVLHGNLVVVVLLCLISNEPGVRVVEVEHHAVLGRASQRAASRAHRAAAQGFRCRAGCSRRTQRARCADSAAPTSAQRDAVTHSLRSLVIAQLIGAALFDDDSVHATGKVSGCVWDQGEEESRRLAFSRFASCAIVALMSTSLFGRLLSTLRDFLRARAPTADDAARSWQTEAPAVDFSLFYSFAGETVFGNV